MKKSDVVSVNRLRPCLRTRHFIFKMNETSLGVSRVAFIFPKKFGNAVFRNRFKRRFRALVTAHTKAGVGYDFLCIAKGALKEVEGPLWTTQKEKFIKFCENL